MITPIDITVALGIAGLVAILVFVWFHWLKPSKGIQVSSKHDVYLRGPDENGTIRAVDQYGNTLHTYFKEPRTVQEEVAYDKAMSWTLAFNKAADIVMGRNTDPKTRALIRGNLDKIWEHLLHVLGNKATAQIWLETPSADLSGEKPIDLMNSGHSDAVLALLENTMMGNPG
jgi:hypothetical protein